MSSRDTLVQIVFLLIVAIGLVAWVVMSQPSETLISGRVKPLNPLPNEVLGESIATALGNREAFGVIPVPEKTADPLRSDPFSQ